MSLQDPIADMLTRIRNGQTAEKKIVAMPASKLKKAVAKVLLDEGYISDFQESENGGKPTLNVALKYFQGSPVISEIKRVSRPGLRIYRKKDELPNVMDGLGIAIISTSKGLMTDRAARKAGFGGEVLCYVS
jgi:small subunit ribosomal protein S8